jgi:hypothetical protein
MKHRRNPVAKHAKKVNKASVHRDKSKYNRKRIPIQDSSFLLYEYAEIV